MGYIIWPYQPAKTWESQQRVFSSYLVEALSAGCFGSIIMPCPEPKTWGEIVNRLVPLQIQIQNILDSLGFDYPDDDTEIDEGRAAALMNCKSDILLTVGVLNLIVGVSQRTIPAERLMSYLGLPVSQEKYFSTILIRLDQYARLSLVTMFQFRIENMIANILLKLASGKVPRPYIHKAEALLKILKLDPERNLKVLNVLQSIRNSLHNNGYHNNDPMKITIDDCLFVFVKGEEVRCAEWRHVILALERTLLVIEKILNAREVRAIPAIPTYYVGT